MSEYHRKYYERNGDKIRQQRRDRYLRDKKYREAKIKNAKDRYKQGELGRIQRRRIALKARAELVRESPNAGYTSRIYRDKVTGAVFEIWSVSHLAKKVGVSTTTIRRWRRRGIMPKPTMKDTGGRLWYSTEYIDKLAEIHVVARAAIWNLDKFGERISQEWPDQTQI